MARTFKTAAYLLLLLGGVGLFGGTFASFGWLSFIPTSVEFPLGDLSGIAVDSSGHIYCGAQFYSRIQEYDPNGHFVAGWFIDCAGGVFRMRINARDELEVATARKGMLYRFAPGGQLIEKKSNRYRAFAEFGSAGESHCVGPDESSYDIEVPRLSSVVVKTAASGGSREIVSVPLHKWLLMGPFPAWFFWMGAVLLLSGLHLIKKRQQQKDRQSTAHQQPDDAEP